MKWYDLMIIVAAMIVGAVVAVSTRDKVVNTKSGTFTRYAVIGFACTADDDAIKPGPYKACWLVQEGGPVWCVPDAYTDDLTGLKDGQTLVLPSTYKMWKQPYGDIAWMYEGLSVNFWQRQSPPSSSPEAKAAGFRRIVTTYRAVQVYVPN